MDPARRRMAKVDDHRALQFAPEQLDPSGVARRCTHQVGQLFVFLFQQKGRREVEGAAVKDQGDAGRDDAYRRSPDISSRNWKKLMKLRKRLSAPLLVVTDVSSGSPAQDA